MSNLEAETNVWEYIQTLWQPGEIETVFILLIKQSQKSVLPFIDSCLNSFSINNALELVRE